LELFRNPTVLGYTFCTLSFRLVLLIQVNYYNCAILCAAFVFLVFNRITWHTVQKVKMARNDFSYKMCRQN